MSEHTEGYIERNRAELVELASKLISFDTSDPPGGGYGAFADFACSWLRGAGLRAAVVPVPEGEQILAPECWGPRMAVVAELKRGKPDGKTLCFQGHYDTVPPCDGWTRDPYTPAVDGGRLYGLGSTDMKGGLAAMMMACKALALDDSFTGNVVFAATPDEEFSSKANLSYFLENGAGDFNLRADYAVVGEFSGISNIYVGMKGGSWGEITVRGKSAHGSVPNKGVNAFEKMAGVVLELERTVKSAFAKQETEFSVLPGELPCSTLMLGGITETTGRARSMVPAYIKTSFDIRTVPHIDQRENENTLLGAVARLRDADPELDIEARVLSRFPGYVIDSGSGFCKAAVEAVERITGSRPSLSVCSAALETAFFNQHGVEPLAYGPGIPGCAHAADEYVLVSEMSQAARVYSLLAGTLAGGAGGQAPR